MKQARRYWQGLPRALRRWLPIGLLGLLTLLVVWQSAKQTWNRELQRLAEQATNELLLHVTSLSGKLEKYEYLAELLTNQNDLSRYLRPETTQDELQQLNLALDRYRITSGVSDIYLMNQEGLTIAASNWWRADAFIGQNFAFRPYFHQGMQGHQGRFYGLGTTSGARGYYFSWPVYANNQVQGVLAVKIEIHAIEQPWHDPGGELLVTDPDGVIFISSRPQWRLSTITSLTPETLQQLNLSLRYAGRILRPLPVLERRRINDQAETLTIQMNNSQSRDYLLLSQPMLQADWQLHIMKELSPVRHQVIMVSLLSGLAMVLLTLIGLYLNQRRRSLRERDEWKEEAHRALQQAHIELENRVAARTVDLSASNQRLIEEIQQHERTETALRKTQKELIQTAKLAVLGQLSASINHELNQPLAALRGYAENARTFLARNNPQTADSNLEQILQLTERMAEISAQLKMFARKSGDQLVPVSVRAACDYALKLYWNQFQQQNIEVIHHFPPDQEVFVLADMVRLEQVLVNLLSNAQYALRHSSLRQILIHTEYPQEDGLDEVKIQVWDTGSGIPAHQLGEIFDPFFTSKETGQGLGLGLSISTRIAQELGGRLEAANHLNFQQLQEPGPQCTGAVFTLYLPACYPEHLDQEVAHV